MRRGGTLQKTRLRWARLFILPSILLLVLVAAFPLTATLFYSLTDTNLSDLKTYSIIGFDNYQYLFSDRRFQNAVMTTVTFTLISVFLEIGLGTAVALLLNRSFRGRGFLRASILVPWAIPTVVSSRIWAWLYHDRFGFINGILQNFGIIENPIAFMGDPQLLLPAIIAVDVWKTTPFAALLILAGLSTIPKELYDAAAVDGASPMRRFITITLPQLKPAFLITITFRTLDAMRVFDVIYIMQGSNEKTASISIYAREQMVDFQEVGTGSAASIIMFLIISIFTIGYMFLLQRERKDGY